MNIADVQFDTRYQVGGQSTTVPTNCFGKLSYYLNCVAACMPGVLEAYLTNYSNWHNFSDKTKAEIFILSAILEPGTLEGRVFNRVSDTEMSTIRPGFDNTFITAYERTRFTLVNVDVDQVVGLNLNNTEITKTMIYNAVWVKKYYYEPLQEVKNIIERPPQHEAVYVRPAPTYQVDTYYNYDNENGCCSPYMSVFYFAFFFGLIGCACAMASVQCRDQGKAWRYATAGFVLNIIVVLLLIETTSGSIFF